MTTQMANCVFKLPYIENVFVYVYQMSEII